MTQYSTGENDHATAAPDDWPEPAYSPPIGRTRVDDKDPRKVIHQELTDWLSVHVVGVDWRIFNEAADVALDRIEDAMSQDGGDWSAPW